MTKTLILAALAATSLGQPAFAEPVTQTVVVQHSDLDLNTVKRRSKGTPDRRRRGTPFSDMMLVS